MTFRPLFTNYNFVLKYCTISGFLNFHFSHLIYEKLNLCLQNTLNMSKMTRVYFGALHKNFPAELQKRILLGLISYCSFSGPGTPRLNGLCGARLLSILPACRLYIPP